MLCEPISLEAFLRRLTQAMRARCISYCIMRNHERLPEENVANDIDFLIRESDVPRVKDAVSAVDGVKVTGFLERPFALHFSFFGVQWGDERRAILVDFNYRLAWKGIPYLDVDEILREARPRSAGPEWIIVPAEEDEAVMSFGASYLVGGFIKEKYQTAVSEVFRRRRDAVAGRLRWTAGSKDALAFVEAVGRDDRDALLRNLGVYRRRMLYRALTRRPLRTAASMVRHYLGEFRIRYTGAALDSVCIMGADGAGKSTVIELVRRELRGAARIVDVRHLKPNLLRRRHVGATVSNPHGKTPRSRVVSVAKVVFWSLEYWIDRIARAPRNHTLLIWDRYFDDLLVDSTRYRYSGPRELVRTLCDLVPRPGRFILLDAPAEILQARKQEVAYEESSRQRKQYRALVAAMPSGVIVDATLPAQEVAASTVEAIVDYLEQQTARRGLRPTERPAADAAETAHAG